MAGYYRQRSKAGHRVTRPAMRAEPDLGAIREFYASGGYCDAPVKKAKGGHLRDRSDDDKVSKESVDYSPGMGKRRCRNCVHYQLRSCELVRGIIDPSYWCEEFERAYAKGGSVTDDLNLYQSQYYAHGGKVDDDLLAYNSQYYAGGGAVSHLRNWLRTLAEGLELPIGVRAPSEVVPKIIEDGRFKSQFETGSSRGMFDPKYRAEVESAVFGLPENMIHEHRPIYGSLFNPSVSNSMDSALGYGDIIAALKSSVKDRSTFTFGDSLDTSIKSHWFNEFGDMRPKAAPQQAWQNLNKAFYRNHPRFEEPPASFSDFWTKHGPYIGYIETQTHRGVPLSDVQRWIMDSGYSHDNDMARWIADTSGVPVVRRREEGQPWKVISPGVSVFEELGPVLRKEDLGYAMGGGVDPEAGQSGVGVYDFTTDGQMPGFAGGGDVAIKFIKNLLSHASKNAREGIDDIRRWTQANGRESMAYGFPDEPNFGIIRGEDRSVAPNQDWFDTVSSYPERTHWNAHSHPPGMLPTPSQDDINFWRTPTDMEGLLGPIDMWIAGSTPSNGLLHMPALSLTDDGYATGEALRRTAEFAFGRNRHQFDRSIDRMSRFDPQILGGLDLADNARGTLLNKLEAGWYINDLAKKHPIYMDADTMISPTVKASDAWPELIKYYDKVGYTPYAEGGQVDEYASGGLIKWLQRMAEPIKAWHGSPHAFDKFDASKIGTGEGAQVYGHGLYFAENPSVAKYYQESLSTKPQDAVNELLRWARGDSSFLNSLRTDPTRLSKEMKSMSGLTKYYENEDVLNNIRSLLNDKTGMTPRHGGAWDSVKPFDNLNRIFGEVPPGHLYEVNLHADPSSFLNLDVPMWKQPLGERARDAIAPAVDYSINSVFNSSMPVGEFSNLIQNPKIAPRLRDVDIPGFSYYDANSRNGMKSESNRTRNYVVFPGAEDIVEIVNRYYLGGSVEDEE